jgi:hypothetical protein
MSIFLARRLRKKHQAEKDAANGQSSDESSGPSQPTQISDNETPLSEGDVVATTLHKKPEVRGNAADGRLPDQSSEPSQSTGEAPVDTDMPLSDEGDVIAVSDRQKTKPGLKWKDIRLRGTVRKLIRTGKATLKERRTASV